MHFRQTEVEKLKVRAARGGWLSAEERDLLKQEGDIKRKAEELTRHDGGGPSRVGTVTILSWQQMALIRASEQSSRCATQTPS